MSLVIAVSQCQSLKILDKGRVGSKAGKNDGLENK